MDIDEIKEKLTELYGPAAMLGIPGAWGELTNLDNATDEELEELAREFNLDDDDYQKRRKR